MNKQASLLRWLPLALALPILGAALVLWQQYGQSLQELLSVTIKAVMLP